MYKSKENKSFDHIIFQNREKNYGAFDLRRRYPKLLIISAFAVNSLFLLLFGSILLYEKYSQYNEFTYIEHVDIEYYSPDTLLRIVSELPQQKNEERINTQTSTFQVTDSTYANTPLTEKKSEQKDSFKIGHDTTQTILSKTKNDTVITKTYLKADLMPEFPGGKAALYRYITANIVSPGDDIMKSTNGMLIVAFCIDEHGSVCNPHIRKNLQPQLDTAVIRVIRSMPKWIPGKNENRNVKVLIHIPIIFSTRN